MLFHKKDLENFPYIYSVEFLKYWDYFSFEGFLELKQSGPRVSLWDSFLIVFILNGK